ncbi:PREDICTED: uncharacterized protein LOC104821508 [Tarenaya hassleriana]|uniref:uncharacterized protein LOC104821508 n=1 Tax=Tarenaya hassleriana TaxID=28532 RepID=UPI00053C485B|nr:PREDICTED: uncharacterized protein LOC104821508 [Tarenaya hassleriana]
MDGRGGCCIARYSGAGPYDLSKVDRVMLRFRPIAPKPATDGGGGRSPGDEKYSCNAESGGSDVSYRTGRGKRKSLKENNGYTRRCNRRKRSEKSRAATAVTLSLLPETPDGMIFPDLKVSPADQKPQGPFWLSFSGGNTAVPYPSPYHTAEMMPQRMVVSSCVTVERVTDAWIDGYGIGRIDGERKMNLERDTCPGFISDGIGRVTWTNDAYKRMARENIPVEGGAPENNRDMSMIVRLVMKERPMLMYTAFTCRVRVQYTCQNREGSPVIVPCDVWRMDGGGFAWRLDVKAALSL